MGNFQLYFDIGFKHIVNIGALDHILFMAAIALRYQFFDFKKLLIIVTAFTIGHAITLALAIFQLISLPKNWIEFLIAVTIIVTSFSNLFVKKFVYKGKFPPIYYFALIFGLIHGMGFASEFVALEGTGLSAALNLLYANIGIEVGQLLFVIVVLVISFICLNILKLNRREYILFTSGAIFGVALEMALTRLPF
ncbi:MAG TPA: HupE/UreJ family protein [Chitinophagaceae bacterium]|nr:HupE/UreJ family protein [Chitinophagaceae bacterium]MCC6635423.1 HupE/UreJ family protein [Chitinophagaceae bacterium]HNM33593.1 HupE/UreJ family protein [Chitinophagaceae bacterium]